jgi:predicted nucleotidyltransferase
MNRTQAFKLLTESKAILALRYGITKLALRGSTARNMARETSDGTLPSPLR